MEPSKDDLFRILRKKDERIVELEKRLRESQTPDSLEGALGKKFTWLFALTASLGESHIKCVHCGCSTKPISGKNGYFLMVCTSCSKPVKKKRTHNAYE